ncbi:MAG: HPF/RaiA family ribosome-associated protein [Salinisphaeraceae bacterium]|nr:HPF/RaiA family ribosome-associated protein [Salinisphaeraceae bacterium]
MQVDIQARPFKLTGGLKHAVRNSLKPLRKRFGDALHRVQVRLDDINGKRGGIDKQCLIVVDAGQRQTVVARALSEDLYQSISMAGQRAERALARNMGKRRAYAMR